MSKMTTNQIRELARKIVGSRSGGIRYSELVQDIAGQSRETPVNTIHGAIWDLATRFPTEIIKPSRGLFQPASAPTTAPTPITIVDQQEVEAGGAEIDFYGPFAEWLKNDLDEVTVVSSLGGAGLKTKWGTPDVVGVYKPTASNLIKFPLEIVSAEIKISPKPRWLPSAKLLPTAYFRPSPTSSCRVRFPRRMRAASSRSACSLASEWSSSIRTARSPSSRSAFARSGTSPICST